MDNLRLPFKLRWAGEPMPDISGFQEPLVIPFWFRKTNGDTSQNPTQPGRLELLLADAGTSDRQGKHAPVT
jgi:hypothetical protein